MFRFPVLPKNNVRTLQTANLPYAKFKQAVAADKQTVFLTQHAVTFVLQGHKMLHFPGETVKIAPPQLIMIRRGIYVMSDFVPEGLQYEALMLLFTDAQLQQFMMQHKLQPAARVSMPPTHLLLNSTPALDAFKEHYLHYFNIQAHNMEAILQVKLQELFLLLLAGPQKAAVLSFLQGISHAQPQDIGYTLSKHLFQPLTLAELAQLSGRSLASFKRDFQQQYNCPPKKWINERRLEHARTLLQHSSKNVSEIAQECGFESVPHFIRIFKQEYGITPNTLRAKKAIL